jgi:hypothetical protein
MPLVRFAFLTFATAFLAPLAAHAAWWVSHDEFLGWYDSDWSSTGVLPPANARPDTAVYVFAGRTGRWKGIFAHHSWIVIKERGVGYTRYDKVAWGRPVKINGWPPDGRWYGHVPTLVAAIEGPAAERLIPKIKTAVARYPYNRAGAYAVWPGPNSNSFVAYVLADIPEAHIVLPPTAIGKDWRVDHRVAGLGAQRHRPAALPRGLPRDDGRLGGGRGDQHPGPGDRHRHPPPGHQAAGLRPHRLGRGLRLSSPASYRSCRAAGT